MKYALKVLQEELTEVEETLSVLTVAYKDMALSNVGNAAYEYAYYQLNSLLEAIDVLKENS